MPLCETRVRNMWNLSWRRNRKHDFHQLELPLSPTWVWHQEFIAWKPWKSWPEAWQITKFGYLLDYFLFVLIKFIFNKNKYIFTSQWSVSIRASNMKKSATIRKKEIGRAWQTYRHGFDFTSLRAPWTLRHITLPVLCLRECKHAENTDSWRQGRSIGLDALKSWHQRVNRCAWRIRHRKKINFDKLCEFCVELKFPEFWS